MYFLFCLFFDAYIHMYSRVPNTTVGNPYSFFGACPSYMALFGTSRLLDFNKKSFLHFYSELLAYLFFPCTTLQLKVFVSNNWWSKSLLMNSKSLKCHLMTFVHTGPGEGLFPHHSRCIKNTNQKILNWTSNLASTKKSLLHSHLKLNLYWFPRKKIPPTHSG